jgi:hypothetical protein
MAHTLREVARDKANVNQLFAERLESEVMSEYMLLALIAEMSMDEERARLLQERRRLQQRQLERAEDDADDGEQAAELERIAEINELVAKPAYAPMSQFSARSKAMASAMEVVSGFQVVGPQRPMNS